MRLKMKVLSAVPKLESAEEGKSIFVDDPNIDLECCAYLQAKAYKEIFNKKKKDASQSNQRLSVLKVKYDNRCIYRKYASKPIEGLKKDCIAISGNSEQQLNLPRNGERTVTVSKSYWLPFYWHHTNSATRISFRIGMWGLLIAIIGLVLSVIK